eukprot:4551597-Amphidinium_carterae.1
MQERNMPVQNKNIYQIICLLRTLQETTHSAEVQTGVQICNKLQAVCLTCLNYLSHSWVGLDLHEELTARLRGFRAAPVRKSSCTQSLAKSPNKMPIQQVGIIKQHLKRHVIAKRTNWTN